MGAAGHGHCFGAQLPELVAPQPEAAVRALFPGVVPLLLLAGDGIFAHLVVEVVIQAHGFALTDTVLGRNFHLGAGQDERADALQIVLPGGLAQVIFERAVAVGLAAQPAHAHRAVEGQCAGFGGHEGFQDAVVAFLSHLGVLFIEVTQAHALGQRVHKHAAAGGFGVVAFAAFLAHY